MADIGRALRSTDRGLPVTPVPDDLAWADYLRRMLAAVTQ